MRGTWQRRLSPRPAQGLKGRVKREAWQEEGTGKSVGRDKDSNSDSLDSVPPSEDGTLGKENQGNKVKERGKRKRSGEENVLQFWVEYKG